MFGRTGTGGTMTYPEVIERLEREKELVQELNTHLQHEVDLISRGDVNALEESMPAKQRLIRKISEIRGESLVTDAAPEGEHAHRLGNIKQDLMVLWKKASGFNELSKQMVNQRLLEINSEVEVFFSSLKDGYTRDGKKSGTSPHTLKKGV
jgi:flagellar biosynthesis/type III secretory pathway chaperone